MASLFHNKPHGKTWMLRWYVGSKQRTRSLHTTDYEVALAEKLAEEKTHPRTRIRWDRIGLDQNPRSRETVFARRHKLASFAVAVLYDEPEKFAYLLSPPRFSTLFELGQIGHSPAALKEVAAAVCGLKLKSVAARVFILNSRGKIRKRPLLTVAVQRAIDAFAKTYPAAFLDTDVAASLRLVASYYAATRQQAA